MRCEWGNRNCRLRKYHDREWGVPEFDERWLFRDLSLEIFQAGLRWDLILRKRSALQAAFADFNPERVARFTALDWRRLLSDVAIIRNQAKITAVIHNARVLTRLHRNGMTLHQLTWRPVHGVPLDHLLRCHEALHNVLFVKRFLRPFRHLGFWRLGPKTLYSYLQAVGVINDHRLGCFRHREINQMTM